VNFTESKIEGKKTGASNEAPVLNLISKPSFMPTLGAYGCAVLDIPEITRPGHMRGDLIQYYMPVPPKNDQSILGIINVGPAFAIKDASERQRLIDSGKETSHRLVVEMEVVTTDFEYGFRFPSSSPEAIQGFETTQVPVTLHRLEVKFQIRFRFQRTFWWGPIVAFPFPATDGLPPKSVFDALSVDRHTRRTLCELHWRRLSGLSLSETFPKLICPGEKSLPWRASGAINT
jgi:hypothetical protein